MISALLKDVFIPEKSGNYYLLSQRVLGFVITKSTVHATQLLRHGYNVTIERFFTEALPTDPAIAFTDRVAVAIKNIVAQADRYDAIRTSLQSSTAIFKNLTLPFLDHEKISMVLTYEIEPYLPFPTTEAVIDFIITKSNKEQKSSEVLVCAVQKSHLVEHLNYFQSAGITPDVVTIDLFDVYGLYCILPKYKTLKGAVAC